MDVRILAEPQFGAGYRQILALARAAEAAAFQGLFLSDHFLTMAGSGEPGPADAWLTLAGLARETTTLRLGTLLSAATFRLPGILAVMATQLDQMSDGRLELGLGAGWYEPEHRTHGIPMPALTERFDRLEEQLRILTGFWATPDGERFQHTGTHYRLQDMPALPRPVQRPRPPLIVGGHGPRRTPRLAARYADEYNVPFESVERTAQLFSRVHDACAAEGRDPAELTLSHAVVLCCGRTEQEVRRRAEGLRRDVDELRENAAAGGPEEVVERLHAYARAGADRCYLQIRDFDDLDHLALVAEQVLPFV